MESGLESHGPCEPFGISIVQIGLETTEMRGLLAMMSGVVRVYAESSERLYKGAKKRAASARCSGRATTFSRASRAPCAFRCVEYFFVRVLRVGEQVSDLHDRVFYNATHCASRLSS